jgi:small conductance mechanosensitive channel
MLPNLVGALVVVVVFGLLARVFARLTGQAIDRWTEQTTLRQLFVTIVRIVVVAVGVFIALGILDLDRTVTSLLAGVGVVGLALGFAFQDIAANFMSGIIMGIRQPLRVGDLVEVEGVIGTVRELSLWATQIATLNGQLVLVPNKMVLQGVLTNFAALGQRRIDIEVGVAYDSKLDQVEEVVRIALEGLDERDTDKPVRVFFTGFGGSSIDLVAHVWISMARQQEFLRTRSNAIKAVKAAFDQANITIPFPIRTLDFGADAVGGKRIAWPKPATERGSSEPAA